MVLTRLVGNGESHEPITEQFFPADLESPAPGGPQGVATSGGESSLQRSVPSGQERGPQRVTKHGRTAVVVFQAEEYERLSRPGAPKGNLVRFFADSPLAGSGIQLERQRDFGRTIRL